MKFLEKDLEEIIYNADRNLLEKKGLYIEGTMKRQLKIGNYGIADLVTFNRVSFFENDFDRFNEKGQPLLLSYTSTRLEITVYELKKENISLSAIMQAVRYGKGIQDYLNERGFNQEVIINIVVIGRRLPTSESLCYIPDVLNNVSFYTYDYEINGLSFKQEAGYSLLEKGFNNE